MADSTQPFGVERVRGNESDRETATVYDAGETRSHDEHAAEARDFARRADALDQMAESLPPGRERDEKRMVAAKADNRAVWHATMAVYEALTDQTRILNSTMIDVQTEVRCADEARA